MEKTIQQIKGGVVMTLIPRIRFQEFLNEWKCTKMSACIEEIVGGAPLTPKDILDEGDFKIIPKKAIQAGGKIIISDNCNYVKKEVYQKYNSNHAKKGDLIIVLRDLVPTGPNIGYIVVNDKVEEGILAQGVYAFRTTCIIDNAFLIQYSNSPQYRKLMQTIMVGSTQVHIKNSVYMNIDMPHGEIKEQKKIANFLSSVDAIIQVQEEEISTLEEQKKGVMQNLFNREIRFNADDGSDFPEWDETTIGEVGYFYYGKSAPKWSVTKDAITPCIRYGELYTTHHIKVKEIKSYTNIDRSNLKFSKGNEVLVPRVGEDPLDFCKCSYLPFADVAIGEMISVYNTKNNPLFISYLFNATMKYEFAKRVEGGNVSNLYFIYLENIPISIPCLEEQQKIVNFLSAYDEAIQIKKEKLEIWKEIKKGLLQQMFV